MRTGLWLLSIRHLQHHKLQTGILVSCIALSAFLPVTTQVLASRYETGLKARAEAAAQLLSEHPRAVVVLKGHRVAPKPVV